MTSDTKKVVDLPRSAEDKLAFIQTNITELVQQGTDDYTIIESIHSYILYWLHATDVDRNAGVQPINKETDKRLS